MPKTKAKNQPLLNESDTADSAIESDISSADEDEPTNEFENSPKNYLINNQPTNDSDFGTLGSSSGSDTSANNSNVTSSKTTTNKKETKLFKKFADIPSNRRISVACTFLQCTSSHVGTAKDGKPPKVRCSAIFTDGEELIGNIIILLPKLLNGKLWRSVDRL